MKDFIVPYPCTPPLGPRESGDPGGDGGGV